MKGNKIYLLLLFAFLVLVFVYQYFAPKEFVWNPTFSRYDKQPFGSYVFDDVMSTSFADYTVENKTFYQQYREAGEIGDLKDFNDLNDLNDLSALGETGEENQLFSD